MSELRSDDDEETVNWSVHILFRLKTKGAILCGFKATCYTCSLVNRELTPLVFVRLFADYRQTDVSVCPFRWEFYTIYTGLYHWVENLPTEVLSLRWPVDHPPTANNDNHHHSVALCVHIDKCWYFAGTPLQRRRSTREPPLLVRIPGARGAHDEPVPEPDAGAVSTPSRRHHTLRHGDRHESAQRHPAQLQDDRRQLRHSRTGAQGRSMLLDGCTYSQTVYEK